MSIFNILFNKKSDSRLQEDAEKLKKWITQLIDFNNKKITLSRNWQQIWDSGKIAKLNSILDQIENYIDFELKLEAIAGIMVRELKYTKYQYELAESKLKLNLQDFADNEQKFAELMRFGYSAFYKLKDEVRILNENLKVQSQFFKEYHHNNWIEFMHRDTLVSLFLKEKDILENIKFTIEELAKEIFSARARKNPRWLSVAKPAVNCA